MLEAWRWASPLSSDALRCKMRLVQRPSAIMLQAFVIIGNAGIDNTMKAQIRRKYAYIYGDSEYRFYSLQDMLPLKDRADATSRTENNMACWTLLGRLHILQFCEDEQVSTVNPYRVTFD